MNDANTEAMDEFMKCPKCGGTCYRDEVDIGVGIQYGPRNCYDCGWSEDTGISQFDDTEEPFK